MSTSGLSAPGAASYSSNTLNVGDGTWDSTRNDFLLPNLVGLNFATMRYNGMGNRFNGLPEYHKLILGHGVLAAIVFLGLVPLSIFLAKWGRDWPGPRVSFKLHVYIQILTVFLTTVIVVLGWFAVGPERSLTNPHHGIGWAIYVLLIVIFLQGTLMYRHERRRKAFPNKLPFGVWIHNLLGRAYALLGIIQVALGLTLYGSPKVLFILYALWAAFLLFIYLALTRRYMPVAGGPAPDGRPGEYRSDYGSYLSETQTDLGPPPPRREHHYTRDLLAAGGALGAYEWFKRRRNQRREEREERYEERYDERHRPPPPMAPAPPGGFAPSGQPPLVAVGGAGLPLAAAGVGQPMATGARPPSQSRISRESWEDEKYSDRPERHTWRDRILGGVGGFAAYEGVKSFFDRRRRRKEDEYYEEEEDSRYGGGLDGHQNRVSRTDVSRVEAGHAPASPDTPHVHMGGVQPMTPTMTPSRPPRRPRPAGESELYDESVEDYDRPLEGGDDPGLRSSIATMGAVAGFREWNKRRRDRREAQRLDNIRRQELENEEQFNRRNPARYPRPADGDDRRTSVSETLMTGPSAQDAAQSGANLRPPDTHQPPLPAAAGAVPFAEGTGGSRHNIVTEEGYSIPPPPPGPPPGSSRPGPYGRPEFGSAQMPQGAVEPDPDRLLSENTAANQASAYGRDPQPRTHEAAEAAGLAAAGLATGAVVEEERRRRHEQQDSPIRQDTRTRLTKRDQRGSITATSASASLLDNLGDASPNSLPVSVKVKMHNDGRHVTLRRLPEEEAAAERAARRQERRTRQQRPRRGSSISSGLDDDPPPGARYRRNNAGPSGIRPSNNQPIHPVPPPPPMSSSAGLSLRRDSELDLPPPVISAIPPRVPQHSLSPQSGNLSSPPPAAGPGVTESGIFSGDAGTGTDVSAFDSNRRRRRAERARRAEALAAARGTTARGGTAAGGGGNVEFV